MEFELNNTKIRVEINGSIWKFGYKARTSKKETWYQLKGSITTNKHEYKCHRTSINKKSYVTSRIIYKAFNLNWNIDNNSFDNSIDHINRNSLDNRIENLRVYNSREQSLNRNFVINAKGYYINKKGKYQAQIGIHNKTINLGYYDTEIEAHQAYLHAVNATSKRI